MIEPQQSQKRIFKNIIQMIVAKPPYPYKGFFKYLIQKKIYGILIGVLHKEVSILIHLFQIFIVKTPFKF